MRLSELQQGNQKGQTRGRQQTQQVETGGEVGTPQNVVPYQADGIRALIGAQQVTIVASGNIVGMSPVKEFIDEHGKFDWASVDDFTVNDPRYLPQASRMPSAGRESASRKTRTTRIMRAGSIGVVRSPPVLRIGTRERRQPPLRTMNET